MGDSYEKTVLDGIWLLEEAQSTSACRYLRLASPSLDVALAARVPHFVTFLTSGW